MALSSDEESAWVPELFGPVYKKRKISLAEALSAYHKDKCTRIMACFVPDELIYGVDLSKKSVRTFNAVTAFIDLNSLFGIYEKYSMGRNGGSYALMAVLNCYIYSVISEIYSNEGDVLNISTEGVFAMWKLRVEGLITKTIHKVIVCFQRIQETLEKLNVDHEFNKVNVVITAGEVVFSVIGDDSRRLFLIGGKPIDELKYARSLCLPGDVVLSEGAWEHCSPSQYEYVIKDSKNVKITKVLGPPIVIEVSRRSRVFRTSKFKNTAAIHETLASISRGSLRTINSNSSDDSFPGRTMTSRLSISDAIRRQLGVNLRTYLLKPVLNQIEKERPLDYLTETRRLTVTFINIIPCEYSINEIITIADKSSIILQKIIVEYGGCIRFVNLYDKYIVFCLVFGFKEYVPDINGNQSENAIMAAAEIFWKLKGIPNVKEFSIGISTGMVFCGVIGHPARRQYLIIGAAVDKAMELMYISYDKISCDYDTVFYSMLEKKQFRPRGIKSLGRPKKCCVYEYIGHVRKMEDGGSSNLDYSYPILGRYEELDIFKDILDEIGVPGRTYSGLLIEGARKVGKSRLLDAIVAIARNRQIRTLVLTLRSSFAEKAYSTLYYVLLQLLDAEDCKQIEDRERILLRKLNSILVTENLCYLNTIMRVRFPLLQQYCSDTEWVRQTKTVRMLEAILHKICGRICIFLDNVQYMDSMSWEYLSAALKNDNVVLAMAAKVEQSAEHSEAISEMRKDKRLLKRTLTGIEGKYIGAFACQFLNVAGIPRHLEGILKKYSGNSIEWCELYMILTLQSEGLDFIRIPPSEAKYYDLIFPHGLLVKRLPKDTTPEELAPPLHWTEARSVNVCIINNKYANFTDVLQDVTGLLNEIYERMNPYEQGFLKCAAVLGTIFSRRILENVMSNSTQLHNSKGKSLKRKVY